jgi:hypothetical protein
MLSQGLEKDETSCRGNTPRCPRPSPALPEPPPPCPPVATTLAAAAAPSPLPSPPPPPPFLRPPLSDDNAACRRRSRPCPTQIRPPPPWIRSYATQIWRAQWQIRRRVGRRVRTDLGAVSSRFRSVGSSPKSHLHPGWIRWRTPVCLLRLPPRRISGGVTGRPFGGGPGSPRRGSPATRVCRR